MSRRDSFARPMDAHDEPSRVEVSYLRCQLAADRAWFLQERITCEHAPNAKRHVGAVQRQLFGRGEETSLRPLIPGFATKLRLSYSAVVCITDRESLRIDQGRLTSRSNPAG